MISSVILLCVMPIFLSLLTRSFILKEKYSVFTLCFLSRVEYQLPNLIVGAVTKESIYGAFENGITAEQVQ